ncbi:MAG TPA: amidohydrolase family protein [Streptosporangiaceae bacterium]|nr:amidohydrolase family protein [Streptosporangiaceae bacterium]
MPEPLPLIDHHVHGVVTGELDRQAFEQLLTEAPGPPAPGSTRFDGQLGFAVRRWCAPVLDLEPFAPAERYLERRAELGAAAVNRRLLTAAGVALWLVDTGYRSDVLTTAQELAAVSGAPARQIVRLEPVAEQVARAGTTATGFAGAFRAALADASASAAAVGYKSIVAYRFGFGFDPARPSEPDVATAAGRLLRALAADPAARLLDEVLLRYLIWTAVDTGLPVQFHAGFGDPDVRLHRSNPSLLHDFLLATQASGTPVMLLHCYPYHREAGYLANVFPHVYLDVGEALNHVGARSAVVLAEALELTPFHKMLYSSDAFGLPELHYLGAEGFRRDIARVTGRFVADGAWSAADADRVAGLIGSANAARVYRLGSGGPSIRR